MLRRAAGLRLLAAATPRRSNPRICAAGSWPARKCASRSTTARSRASGRTRIANDARERTRRPTSLHGRGSRCLVRAGILGPSVRIRRCRIASPFDALRIAARQRWKFIFMGDSVALGLSAAASWHYDALRCSGTAEADATRPVGVPLHVVPLDGEVLDNSLRELQNHPNATLLVQIGLWYNWNASKTTCREDGVIFAPEAFFQPWNESVAAIDALAARAAARVTTARPNKKYKSEVYYAFLRADVPTYGVGEDRDQYTFAAALVRLAVYLRTRSPQRHIVFLTHSPQHAVGDARLRDFATLNKAGAWRDGVAKHVVLRLLPHARFVHTHLLLADRRYSHNFGDRGQMDQTHWCWNARAPIEALAVALTAALPVYPHPSRQPS